VNAAARLAARPGPLLVALALIQVAAAVIAATALAHNGWLWVDGGEQVTSATDAWLLGRAHLPPAGPGYAWPLLLAPVTWVTGATWLQAAPFAVALNVLVLGPLALACVYGIALRLAGRLVAAWTAAVWVAAPFVAIGFWKDEVRTLYVDDALPRALGLTGFAAYPSLVALAASGWLVLRAVDARAPSSAALAGLAAGAAAGIQAANLLFLVGAGAALLVSRRWREGAVFAAALVPALLTVLLWRSRTTGAVGFHLDLDWDAWTQQMSELREFSVGARVAQWAPLAGVVALALLRRWAGAVLLLGWLGAMLAVQGTLPGSTIEGGTFVPLLLPAVPAYVVLVSAVPLLVPTAIRRLGIRPADPPTGSVGRGVLAAAGIVLAVLPLAVVLAARAPDDAGLAVVQPHAGGDVLVAVDDGLAVRAEAAGDGTRLTWDDATAWRSRVWYRVLRTVGPEPDVTCERDGATRCSLITIPLGQTRDRTFVDHAPRPGATYRVSVLANVADDEHAPAGAYAVSPPAQTLP
jgi:hypothetical protein